jgi:phosphatidylglycerol---prolipoprotein diacylglyceryl transferase
MCISPSLSCIAWFYWDPSRFVFTIPVLGIPVTWYGFFFAFGFFLGFFTLLPIFQKKLSQTRDTLSEKEIRDLSLSLMDRLTWFVVAGTVIGARLGHVFFYEWPRYAANPIDIFKVWEGGLASHGGALGIILAVGIYQRTIRKKFPELTFLTLLDCLSIPTALVGMFIRIGNFFNQEITGPETSVPWAIVFGHPMEWARVVPRHPAQLYEAFAYLLIFLGLALLWKKKGNTLREGTLLGLFMVLVFGSRFVLEYFKASMSLMIDESFLHAGQYLSIPFILFGLYLLLRNLFHNASRGKLIHRNDL